METALRLAQQEHESYKVCVCVCGFGRCGKGGASHLLFLVIGESAFSVKAEDNGS